MESKSTVVAYAAATPSLGLSTELFAACHGPRLGAGAGVFVDFCEGPASRDDRSCSDECSDSNHDE